MAAIATTAAAVFVAEPAAAAREGRGGGGAEDLRVERFDFRFMAAQASPISLGLRK
jgi:hypothetical protein